MHLQALVCQRNDAHTHSKTHSKTGSEKQSKTGRKNPGNRSHRGSPFIPSEAVLIVTQKDQIEVWAGIIRDLSEPRLFLYTDTLAKRRKTGAHNLAQYDVVITTFDVRTMNWTFRLVIVSCCSVFIVLSTSLLCMLQ
jgi:hypothetical protein